MSQERLEDESRCRPLSGPGEVTPRWRLNVLLFRAAMAVARPFCRSGRLRIRYRSLAEAELGDGTGPEYVIRLERLRALFRILANPELAVGETFMDGDWEPVRGDLSGLLGVMLVNQQRFERSLPVRMLAAVRNTTGRQTNEPMRSRRNAAHHYDIGNDLYEAFLDEEMVYSCAFFDREAQSLEAAQRRKLELTLDRLEVGPGMHLLDIGCGWGAMTRAAARRGAHAVGITLADRQLALAEERVPEELRDRITYRLEDYRHHAERHPEGYDRIVSIGMFEHVGAHHFVTYFDAIRRMLRPGGRALVHSICKHTRSPTNPWIDKYIFPGGFIPRLQDMMDSARAAGLRLAGEPFIHESEHYATTLRHWRSRFNAAYPSLDHDKYDERFRRMWDFYLAGSQAAFDALGFYVAQVPLERGE